MIWVAPSERDLATDTLEKRLWDSADHFRANSGLKAQANSSPILGITFLWFGEVRFAINSVKNLRWTRKLLLPGLLSGQIGLL